MSTKTTPRAARSSSQSPSVTSQTAPAKGLGFWRKELLKVSLPALASTGARLKPRLRNPDSSLREIEEVVAEDPVLSFQLLTQANKLRANPENDVLSLPHALSLLGMDKLKPLLSRVKYIQFDAKKTAHNAFLQALNTSLHAATQAYYIAEQKMPGSGEAHYWISLRLSSVYWLLSLSAPKMYHSIEQRVQTGESRHRVEQELLGCSSQELTRALLPDWKLSEFTQANLNKLLAVAPKMLSQLSRCAWQEGFAPEVPKEQGRFLQTPWVAAVLCHWLALNTAVNWYTPKTARIERILATYLHQPLDAVTALLHRNAVHCSASHGLTGGWTPAIKLLHPPLAKRSVVKKQPAIAPEQKAKRYKDLSSDTRQLAELKPVRVATAPLQAVPVKPASKQAALPPKTQPPAPLKKVQAAVQTALFKLFYLQTVKQKQVFSIHQMMDGASQVMHFDLGLTRCILFMKSRSQGIVKGVYAKGFEDNTPFGKMMLSADSEHLFGKLLTKQAALWATQDNKSRYVTELPDGLWPELNNPEEFALSSIMLRGKVSGILYADNRGSDKKLDASSYATFRAVAQAISHGMDTLANLKEQQQRPS